MQVLEVPTPVLSKGMVLVRNHYSLISVGTEGSTVSTARKSLIGKAKERPQQVKQVIDVAIQQGPVQAYRAVMKKLDSYLPEKLEKLNRRDKQFRLINSINPMNPINSLLHALSSLLCALSSLLFRRLSACDLCAFVRITLPGFLNLNMIQ